MVVACCSKRIVLWMNGLGVVRATQLSDLHYLGFLVGEGAVGYFCCSFFSRFCSIAIIIGPLHDVLGDEDV